VCATITMLNTRTSPRILLFLMSWWTKADIEAKERVVRMLNNERRAGDFSLGIVRHTPRHSKDQISRFERGLMTGEDLKAFRGRKREGWSRFIRDYAENREQFALIEKWRNGAPLPRDLRRCQFERCRRFFLVGKRPGQLSCSTNCGSYFRIQKAKRRDLDRINAAMKSIPADAPDWKERVARKARVTPNFITYAIRRGEVSLVRLRLPAQPVDATLS
jgi:hypothetical protein